MPRPTWPHHAQPGPTTSRLAISPCGPNTTGGIEPPRSTKRRVSKPGRTSPCPASPCHACSHHVSPLRIAPSSALPYRTMPRRILPYTDGWESNPPCATMPPVSLPCPTGPCLARTHLAWPCLTSPCPTVICQAPLTRWAPNLPCCGRQSHNPTCVPAIVIQSSMRVGLTIDGS
jgi:hypothetical protein